MGCGSSKQGPEANFASPTPILHAGNDHANISPTVARGDPDEPRDEVSLHASTCAIKWQAAG